jgi:branched-chain amino acid transport system substrate-binding protein
VIGLSGCSSISPVPPAPDRVRIGYALSMSGPYATSAATVSLPNYRLWIDDVNQRGGLWLSRYGKRVPIEAVEYDDQSDVERALQLDEQLITTDKVDLLLPSWGTAMQVATASIFNRYQYPDVAALAQSQSLRERAIQLPYVFWFLPQPDETAARLEGYLKQLRDAGRIGNRVAILSVSDDHGIEMASALTPALATDNFSLVYSRSYPLGTRDVSARIKDIQQQSPNVFIAFSYPDDTMLITRQSIALGFNPQVFYTSIGTAFPQFGATFGTQTEGVTGFGSWVTLVNPPARDWEARYHALFQQDPDRWAGAYQYAALQVLEQSIEKVGYIDRPAIRDAIAAGQFDTIVGPISFTGQFNAQQPPFVGQWQDGQFRPVESADGLQVPKPAW